jgi:hypothetical protein
MDHLYEDVYERFCGHPPKEKLKGTNKTKDNTGVTFRTYQHPEFKPFQEAYHVWNGPNSIIKVIPENIADYLTPRSLAYIHMADGTLENGCYILCLDSFPLQQVEYFTNALQTKFNLHAEPYTYHKQYFRVRIFKESSAHFTEMIKPYVIDCMQYKLQH